MSELVNCLAQPGVQVTPRNYDHLESEGPLPVLKMPMFAEDSAGELMPALIFQGDGEGLQMAALSSVPAASIANPNQLLYRGVPAAHLYICLNNSRLSL